MPQESGAWDVDLTIRYSDDRLCEVAGLPPETPRPATSYRDRRANLGDSLTEAVQKAWRLFAHEPRRESAAVFQRVTVHPGFGGLEGPLCVSRGAQYLYR
jgi:hypothetical protein